MVYTFNFSNRVYSQIPRVVYVCPAWITRLWLSVFGMRAREKSQYVWNKNIIPWKNARTIFIHSLLRIKKLTRSLHLSNSWIKNVRAHSPWSNLSINILFTIWLSIKQLCLINTRLVIKKKKNPLHLIELWLLKEYVCFNTWSLLIKYLS